MNSQQIVIFARQLANCDTTQVPDADTSTQIGALTYLNIAYAQVVSRVNQDTGEDIFSEIATFDLVNGQTEYSYPTKSSILTGFDALLAVSINYNLNSVVDWKRLRPSRISNLNRDEFWHTTNQPFTDPFYIKYDSGIRIFPNATQAVSGGGKLYYTKVPIDLTLSPLTTPILDTKWHTVISFCMATMFWKALGNPDRSISANADYEAELNKASTNSGLSDIHPFERESPSLTHFQ